MDFLFSEHNAETKTTNENLIAIEDTTREKKTQYISILKNIQHTYDSEAPEDNLPETRGRNIHGQLGADTDNTTEEKKKKHILVRFPIIPTIAKHNNDSGRPGSFEKSSEHMSGIMGPVIKSITEAKKTLRVVTVKNQNVGAKPASTGKGGESVPGIRGAALESITEGKNTPRIIIMENDPKHIVDGAKPDGSISVKSGTYVSGQCGNIQDTEECQPTPATIGTQFLSFVSFRVKKYKKLSHATSTFYTSIVFIR